MQADIYITLDSRNPQKTEKHYGYVLECQVNGAPVTREGFGSVKEPIIRRRCGRCVRRFGDFGSHARSRSMTRTSLC